MSSMLYDREVVRCPSTRHVLWSCSGMLRTLTLRSSRSTGFVFGLNGSLRAKVRILMPQTLHDAIQKALIVEEELISGGQTRTPVRPVGQGSSGHRSIRHQRDIRRDIVASRGDPLFTTPRRPSASAEDTLSRTTAPAAASPAAAAV
jgi:hypothetical protein